MGRRVGRCEGMAGEPVKHDAVGFCGHLLEYGVAAAGDGDEFGVVEFAAELDAGIEADGEVGLAPDEERGCPADAAQGGLELDHLREPATNDAEDVAQGSGAPQAVDDLLQAFVGDAMCASVHFSESNALEGLGQKGQHAGEQTAPAGAIDADHQVAGAVVRIGGREEDEAADAAGMQRREHEGD